MRSDCGVFDVSHMTVVDVDGSDATAWLQRLLANDVARLEETGKALYSPLLHEEGGVIDDLIVYRTENGYRLVTNAATRARVLDWLQQQQAGFAVDFQVRPDLAILAIQGPRAREKVAALLSPTRAALIRELRPFEGVAEGDWFIARTGYTGEDGLEIIFPGDQAVAFFNDLVGAGIAPSGLGARDTLRLEAGMNLYGQDIDEAHTPLTSNLGWSIAWEPAERDFIGRAGLLAEIEQGVQEKLVGLVLEERGVLRAHQVVRVAGIGEGEITSGSFSPTLSKAIALARVPLATADRAEVEIRGKWYPVRVVKPTFVRQGKILI